MLTSKETLGIEIGNQFLKIIHINNKQEILNWISTDISALSNEAIADFIRNFIKDKQIKSIDVINHIPAANTITKNIELPATNADEIRKMIKLQAGQYSPYSSEEVIIDYIPLGVSKEDYTRVFLFIVKRDDIKRNADIIGQAGLTLSKTVLAIETMVLWYRDRADNPISLLHVDYDKADFLVIHKEKPFFLRNIPVGASQLSYDRETYLQSLIEEIGHSLETYQTELHEPVTKIIITGAGSGLGDALTKIQEAHHIDVELDDTFKDFTLAPELAAMKDALANMSVFGIGASAVKYPKTQIDLTPEEVKHKASTEAKGKDTFWLGILVGVILILWAGLLIEGLIMKNMLLGVLTTEHKKYAAEATELREKQKNLLLVKKYFSRRTFAMETLAEVYDTCVAKADGNIIISGIVYNDDKQPGLIIRGTANSNDDALKMVGRLGKSTRFKQVNLKNSQAHKELDRKTGTVTENVDFEVVCGFVL